MFPTFAAGLSKRVLVVPPPVRVEKPPLKTPERVAKFWLLSAGWLFHGVFVVPKPTVASVSREFPSEYGVNFPETRLTAWSNWRMKKSYRFWLSAVWVLPDPFSSPEVTPSPAP